MEWKNPDGSLTNGVVIEDGAGNKLGTSGNPLNVTGVSGGSGSNASVGSTGGAVPASATAIGYQNGAGNLVVPTPSSGLPVIIATLPGGSNALGSVAQTGSLGLDYSANKPALPNVGANFAAGGPYASYVLIATVAASPTRNNIDIENTSGAQIIIVRDDGTAANAAAPVNASVFALGGGSGAGAQGGSWTSQTFKGRVQVYAPASTAQVAIFVD